MVTALTLRHQCWNEVGNDSRLLGTVLHTGDINQNRVSFIARKKSQPPMRGTNHDIFNSDALSHKTKFA